MDLNRTIDSIDYPTAEELAGQADLFDFQSELFSNDESFDDSEEESGTKKRQHVVTRTKCEQRRNRTQRPEIRNWINFFVLMPAPDLQRNKA